MLLNKLHVFCCPFYNYRTRDFSLSCFIVLEFVPKRGVRLWSCLHKHPVFNMDCISVSIVTGFDRYFCKGCYTKLEKKKKKKRLQWLIVWWTWLTALKLCFVWYRNRLDSLVRGCYSSGKSFNKRQCGGPSCTIFLVHFKLEVQWTFQKPGHLWLKLQFPWDSAKLVAGLFMQKLNFCLPTRRSKRRNKHSLSIHQAILQKPVDRRCQTR